jgi:hypothetical protein
MFTSLPQVQQGLQDMESSILQVARRLLKAEVEETRQIRFQPNNPDHLRDCWFPTDILEPLLVMVEAVEWRIVLLIKQTTNQSAAEEMEPS